MLPASNKVKITFKIHYQCNYGYNVFVVGSLEQLGGWKVCSALRLGWNEGHYWSKTIELENKEMPVSFNYKYIVALAESPNSGYIIWEQGLNRCFRIEQHTKPFYNVNDKWEFQKIKVLVKNFFGPEEFWQKGLGVAGKLVMINQKDNFTKMTLLCKKEEDSDKKVMAWRYSAWIPLYTEEISYSLYFVDAIRSTVIKNRRVECLYILRPSNALQGLQKGIEVRKNTIVVAEILSLKDFMYTEISDKIILGSCINEIKERALLVSEKVGAILSLETPNDEARVRREEEMLMIKKLLSPIKGLNNDNEIPVFKFPIEDCAFEVVEKAVKGAQFLKHLIETQKRVYVHCTFGVARSVHVVIAYLCLHEGMDLSSAIKKVRDSRRQARPNEDVCFEMFKGLETSSPKMSTDLLRRRFFKRNMVNV